MSIFELAGRLAEERHLSLDLETLGTRPGSVVLSIGAVVFRPATGEICRAFHANLLPEPQIDAGMTADAATAQWWAAPARRQAWEMLLLGRQPPLRALGALAGLFEDWHCTAVWGHGAGFDVTLTEAAMGAFGIVPPWHFTVARDTRTLFAAAGVQVDRSGGLHHHALADATAQAEAVVRAYRALGLSGGAVRRAIGGLLRAS